MTDVLVQMNTAGWRQIEFPLTERDFGFAHSQAKHRYIFRDQQLIESLGRENPTYRYVIPFREDIAAGNYANLFTTVYPEFLDACLDRTRGVLEDPVHGAVRVKCVSLRELLSVGKRDGIDVEAMWIVAPTEEELTEDLGTQIATLQGAENLAGLFDQGMQAIPLPPQEQPPEPTVDPFDFITGIGDQLDVARDKIDAKLNDVSYRAERAIETIDRLQNPELAPTRQAARRLQGVVLELERRGAVGGVRPVRSVSARVDYSTTALARRLGLTMQQFARLNPELTRRPLVTAGTQVRTYDDVGSERTATHRRN